MEIVLAPSMKKEFVMFVENLIVENRPDFKIQKTLSAMRIAGKSFSINRIGHIDKGHIDSRNNNDYVIGVRLTDSFHRRIR
jgi:hypothetical protein